MIKQITLEVNDYCNNACIMCNIHLNEWKDKTSPEEYKQMFIRPEFKSLKEVSITGGEPFSRKDINKVMDAIIDSLPNLEWVFINTNGTYLSKLKDFVETYVSKVKKLSVSVSLEGKKEVHEKIRGVNSFDTVIKTLEFLSAFSKLHSNFSFTISTTITPFNANESQLLFIKDTAEKYGSTYTFRIAGTSKTYYLNDDSKSMQLTREQMHSVIKFITENCKSDVFQQFNKKYIETGQTGLTCTAGTDFAFVRADGNIYPCIFSTRVIGDKKQGITVTNIADLGKFEPCPCCTECTVYEMINYGPASNLESSKRIMPK